MWSQHACRLNMGQQVYVKINYYSQCLDGFLCFCFFFHPNIGVVGWCWKCGLILVPYWYDECVSQHVFCWFHPLLNVFWWRWVEQSCRSGMLVQKMSAWCLFFLCHFLAMSVKIMVWSRDPSITEQILRFIFCHIENLKFNTLSIANFW